jgi:hypothetical protein
MYVSLIRSHLEVSKLIVEGGCGCAELDALDEELTTKMES